MRPEFRRHAERAHAHAVFCHGVGDVVLEPARPHVERRREIQNMRIGGLLEIGNARLRTDEGAADVDAEHEIEALHRRGERAGERDRARIVDECIDAAERVGNAFRSSSDRGLVAHVELQRQRPATGGFDFLGDAVDGACQPGMGVGGLAGDHDVGAVARAAQRDLAADAAARTGDENRFSLQPRHLLS